MSELERALLALGRELEVPEAPDLAGRVAGGLGPRRARVLVLRRRLVAAFALAVLAAVLAVLAVPEARSALLRVLHLGGERIELVDELPEVPADASGLDALLGERVSLAAARERMPDLRTPEGPPPDRVYVDTRGTIWLLWGTPDRVRLLLAQTPRASAGADLFVKKLAGPGTTVERVSVAGAPGYFLSGEPHVVLLLDEFGDVVEERAWLAESVLVWEEPGVALRLEGEFDRSTALELAASLR